MWFVKTAVEIKIIALMPFLFKARLSHINQTDIRYVFYLLKLNNTRIRFLLTEIKYHMNTCKYLLSICGLPYRYLKRTLRTILICFANKKKCSYSSLMSSKDIWLEKKKKKKKFFDLLSFGIYFAETYNVNNVSKALQQGSFNMVAFRTQT